MQSKVITFDPNKTYDNEHFAELLKAVIATSVEYLQSKDLTDLLTFEEASEALEELRIGIETRFDDASDKAIVESLDNLNNGM